MNKKEEKEYIAYTIFIGIPNKLIPSQEKTFIVFVKNDPNISPSEREKKVVQFMEEKFPGKKVLNIGIRTKEEYLVL